MNLRQLLLVLLVGVTLYVTQGCDGNNEGWEAKPSHQSLPAVMREVPVADVARTCGNYHNKVTHGCVWRDYSTGLCYVYHGPGVAPWLLQHEALHCAGYDHA